MKKTWLFVLGKYNRAFSHHSACCSTLAILMVSLSACQLSGDRLQTTDTAISQRTEDLLVVDCLLPPQIRRLGTRVTYLTARRVIQISAGRCAARGGEYLRPEHATPSETLSLWMPSAQSGDAEAQNHVGQIYEATATSQAQYALAAHWYSKATMQKHRGAMVNLGTLYKDGLGVPRNTEQSTRLYRMALGDNHHSAHFQPTTPTTERASHRTEKSVHGRLLGRRTAQLKRSRASHSAHQTPPTDNTVPPPGHKLPVNPTNASALSSSHRLSVRSDAVSAFGRYHALIIVQSDYTQQPPLPGAQNTAAALQDTLQNHYRFSVQMLRNTSKRQLLATIDALNDQLDDQTNLLLYYMGRSYSDPQTGACYWLLPQSTATDSNNHRIDTHSLNRMLDALPVKHLLLISDACHSNLSASQAIAQPLPTISADIYRQWLSLVAQSRVRTVMHRTSPAYTQHSPALLGDAINRLLRDNNGTLEAYRLFSQAHNALRQTTPVSPPASLVYAPIKHSQHEAGEFIFIRSRSVQTAKP